MSPISIINNNPRSIPMLSKFKVINCLDNDDCAYNSFVLALSDLIFYQKIDSIANTGSYQKFIEICNHVDPAITSWKDLKHFFNVYKDDPLFLQNTFAPLLRSLVANLDEAKQETLTQALLTEFKNYINLKFMLEIDETANQVTDIFYKHKLFISKFQFYSTNLMVELIELIDKGELDFDILKLANRKAVTKQILSPKEKSILTFFNIALEQQTKLLQSWFEQEGYTLFAKEVELPSRWTGDLELSKLAAYFKINLTVMDKENQGYPLHIETPSTDSDMSLTIHLSNQADINWLYLQPKEYNSWNLAAIETTDSNSYSTQLLQFINLTDSSSEEEEEEEEEGEEAYQEGDIAASSPPSYSDSPSHLLDDHLQRPLGFFASAQKNPSLMHFAKLTCQKLDVIGAEDKLVQRLISAYNFSQTSGNIGRNDCCLLLNPIKYAHLNDIKSSVELPKEVNQFSKAFTCDILLQAQTYLPEQLAMDIHLLLSLKLDPEIKIKLGFITELNNIIIDPNFTLLKLKRLLDASDFHFPDIKSLGIDDLQFNHYLSMIQKQLQNCHIILEYLTTQKCAASILTLLKINTSNNELINLFAAIEKDGFNIDLPTIGDIIEKSFLFLIDNTAAKRAIEAFVSLFSTELPLVHSSLCMS